MSTGWVFDVLDSLLPAISLLSFLIFLLMVYLNRAHLKEAIKKISKSSWLVLGVLFLLALALTWVFSPKYYLMYTDEAMYMLHGKEILHAGSTSPNLKYVGWPFFISLVFGLISESNTLVISLTLLLSSLPVILIFLVAYLLIKSEAAGLIAALIFALYPARILMGGTAETNTFSSFFTLISIFLALVYYRKGGSRLFFLALSSFTFNALNRPENFMFILLFLFGSLIFQGRQIRKFSKSQARGMLLPLLLFGLLIILPFARLIMWMAPVDWASSDTEGAQSGDNWSIANLINNTRDYGHLIFGYEPFWIMPIILLGVILALFQKRRECLFLLAWVILLYLAFFLSWPTNFPLGMPQRFFLSFYPSLFIFAAFALERVFRLFNNLTESKLIFGIVCSIIIVALMLSFYPHILKISAEQGGFAYFSLEMRMSGLVKDDAKEGCMILAPLPELLEPNSKHKLIQLSKFIEENTSLKSLLKNNSCVMFAYELVCARAIESPGEWESQSKYCRYMFDNFELSLYKEYTERDAAYRLYYVGLKEDLVK